MIVMKKSILETGIAESNMLYSDILTENTKKHNTDINHKKMDVYEWNIETEIGNFSGTCLTINDLNKEIAKLTNNAKILKKNITPVSITNENLDNKVYSWNVITTSGHASGVSLSLEEAKTVVNSFDNKEVIKSNIEETFTNK
jgi:hypothetical protein